MHQARSRSIENMVSDRDVDTFLGEASWRSVRRVDLGRTAWVYIVEREGERRALKASRDGGDNRATLRTEQRLVRYLRGTPMRKYVPRGRGVAAGGGGLPYDLSPLSLPSGEAGDDVGAKSRLRAPDAPQPRPTGDTGSGE